MRSMMVVKMQVAAKHQRSLLGVRVGQSVCPFARERLNEAIDFAVRARRVRLGANVAQTESLAAGAESSRESSNRRCPSSLAPQ